MVIKFPSLLQSIKYTGVFPAVQNKEFWSSTGSKSFETINEVVTIANCRCINILTALLEYLLVSRDEDPIICMTQNTVYVSILLFTWV